jgi:hypothetical protein
MAKEPKKIGELDGWTITEDEHGVMHAEKDGVRPCTVGGGKDTPRETIRARLFEAMAESDGVAAAGSGHPAARAGAIVHEATIVVHDEKE